MPRWGGLAPARSEVRALPCPAILPLVDESDDNGDDTHDNRDDTRDSGDPRGLLCAGLSGLVALSLRFVQSDLTLSRGPDELMVQFAC